MSRKMTDTRYNYKKTFAIFSSLLGLSVLNIPTVQATVTDGVRAYNAGDYERAREEWLAYADIGDANALFNLGQLYRMGRGVDVDYGKSEKFYIRAAEKGHIGAQSNLGTLYYFSKVENSSLDKAVHWWTLAGENGDDRSQYMIGVMHHNGQNVPQNDIKAFAWLYLASKSNLGDAVIALEMLAKNLSPEDISKAKTLAPSLLADHAKAEYTYPGYKSPKKPSPQDVKSTRSPLPEVDMAVEAKAKQIEEIAKPVAREVIAQKSAVITKPKVQKVIAPVITTELPTAASMTHDKWRIQIAAYRSKQVVQDSFRKLQAKHPSILSQYNVKSQRVDRGDKPALYRMQLVSFAVAADAKAVCAELKQVNVGCFVVKAK